MKEHYLKSIFEPESIAIIGATERKNSIGSQVLSNVLKGGFKGKIYAINPKHEQVRGLTCYPSLSDIDDPIDLVIFAIPAKRIPKVMHECSQHPVRAVIVLSAGFAETGKKGLSLQNEIVDIARTSNIPLMGPDCLGIIRPKARLNATFARSSAREGHVALVAQSAAFCSALLDWADNEGFGFSAVTSMGTTSDVGFGDVLDFLADDPETQSILLYVEDITDARSFISGLRVAARLKPVIVVKPGRNASGTRSTDSLSATNMCSDNVFDAAIQRAGAVRVDTVNQLFAATQTLAAGIRVDGPRLAIVTNGRAPGVMAADRAADLPLPLAGLAKESIHKLNKLLPEHWSHSNPVDILDDADPSRYETTTQIVLSDNNVDGILILLTPQGMTDPTGCARAVIRASKKSGKPVLACWMGESLVAQGRKLFSSAGIPQFHSPEAGVDAFGYLACYRRNQKSLLQAPAPLSRSREANVEGAREIVQNAINERRFTLSNTESKAVLQAFHIPTSPSINAVSASDALAAAESLGLPVAMKINSPGLLHEPDITGAHVNIREPKTVKTAFREMMGRMRDQEPEAIINGVTIEPMLERPHAREIMIGILRDPVFGPVITLGAGGGSAVESFADNKVALPPLNRYLSKQLIKGAGASACLRRFRTLSQADTDKLTDVLQRISEIACELPEIKELSINPFLVDEHGAIAVDARVTVGSSDASNRGYDHMAIHPYPTGLESGWQLADGTNVIIRPIRPEDANIEQVFVKQLSAESKYFRFMHGLDHLSPLMLARLTQIDYDREMALIAVVNEESDQACIIGVVRYSMNPDRHSCEFALTVGDEYQGKGVGRYLMQCLMTVASDRGIDVIEGEVLTNNVKMIKLMERLHFRLVHLDGEPEVVHVRRHL